LWQQDSTRNYKKSGLSATLLTRTLKSPQLPPAVRAKIIEYIEAKAAGGFGHNKLQQRRFVARLKRGAALIVNSPRPEVRDRVIGSNADAPHALALLCPASEGPDEGSTAERGHRPLAGLGPRRLKVCGNPHVDRRRLIDSAFVEDGANQHGVRSNLITGAGMTAEGPQFPQVRPLVVCSRRELLC
jgi:hypothetical protein